ncbi:MAG: hypothetical protein RJA76_1563, partial [Bacteroidota bacterium]
MIKLFILGSLFSFSDSSFVALKTTISTINQFHSQYFPQLNKDKNEIYITVRKNKGDHEDLYVAKIKQGIALPASPIEQLNNTFFNEGTCSFSEDGNTMVFSACDYPNSKGGCDLYESQWINNEWTSPKNLGYFINSREWDGQPHLTNAGRTLYFSSERMGGFGGRDLWLSEKDNNGIWRTPKNLGTTINTKYNEIGPYYIKNKQILIFSSDRKNGLGKLDFYQSLKDENTWTDPKNIEYLNTSEDDAGICEGIYPNEFFITLSSKSQEPQELILSKLIPETIWIQKIEKKLELPPRPKINFQELSFQDIFFENNKWDLPKPYPKSLDKLVIYLEENPRSKIIIEGHSDETGNANNNIILSEKRAFAVKNYLLNAGISTDRINCQGFGHSKPKS